MGNERLLIERPDGLLLHRTEQSAERSWREDATYKLLFSPAGTISYQTQARSYTLQPDQFLIMNPNLPHRQIGYERQKFLIELSSRLLREVADSTGVRPQWDIQFALLEQKHLHVTQWVRFNIDILSSCLQLEGSAEEPSSAALFLDHALVQLALLLLQHGIGSHSSDLSIHHAKKASPHLFAAMDAMKQSYAEAWSLDEMARTAKMNKYQFAHLFKEAVGVSPYSWLQLYRLIRSQSLLQHTDQPILQIAMSSGFSSLTVYHQLFKRLYGVSPAVFRKRYR